MFVIILCFAIIFFNVGLSAYSYLQSKSSDDFKFFAVSKISKHALKLFPRTTKRLGRRMLFQQVIMGYVLLYIFDKAELDLDYIGIKYNFNYIVSFIFGASVYVTFIFIWSILLKSFRNENLVKDTNYLVMRSLIPRQRIEKLFSFIAICVANPFIEEILYRGVLVYYLGNYFNNIYLAIIIGLLMSLGSHLYQGVASVIFHSLFFSISVLLLYSPFGLIACFGLHFAGDLYPIIKARKSMFEWRKRNEIIYKINYQNTT